jgi:hypothetical protein
MKLVKITRIDEKFEFVMYAVTAKDKLDISFKDLEDFPKMTLELLSPDEEGSEVKILD